MPLHVSEEIRGNVLEVHVTGKLGGGFRKICSRHRATIQQYGKIRVLMVMRDFHGWDAPALWEDIKWDAKHFNQVERVAMVGDKKWQEWMAVSASHSRQGRCAISITRSSMRLALG